MQNVYLFEINDILANQAKLPYSTGLIWSYCSTIPEIDNAYTLGNLFFWRQSTEDYLKQIENPSVVGFSCFVWNWTSNIEMAKAIKDKYPDCLIVFGGWQVPMSDRIQGFFRKHPYVDIAVHGEGELTFADILLENLKGFPEWEKIEGCSVPYRMLHNKKSINRIVDHGLVTKKEIFAKSYKPLDTFTTKPRARIKSIASMPSPYLDGLFDRLIKDCNYDLEATFETTRGCPYACTYCEIGTKYYQKIKYHGLEKIYAEIDWMSENKVVFVYNADSNFGMLKDHLPITKYLVDKKKLTGYPQKHRCDWSKNQADKVIELAKIFYEAEMDKGITIALQSMNPATLKAIKRKNVDGGKLKEFISMYEGTNLPSYIELILGLPEETKDSFVNGICKVMELGQHNYIGIYPLTALPNTPFGDDEYIQKYGLKIIDTYPAFSHVDIDDTNVSEREHMVVSSNTMTLKDYKEASLYRWLFMFGHYLGTTQFFARFINKHFGTSYEDFYKGLMNFMLTCGENSFLGSQLNKTSSALDGVLDCVAPWGRVVNSVRENFAWDFEEATVIEIMQNKSDFYTELQNYIIMNHDVGIDLLKDLVNFQDCAMMDPRYKYPITESFKYNIFDVIHNEATLQEVNEKLEFSNKNYDGDYFEYGKETLWWGRRVASYKCKITKIESQ
tara:strand:- start:16437 stop:18449 length:2013 start_codon:yes stop_codon:yes gene_type:complete